MPYKSRRKGYDAPHASTTIELRDLGSEQSVSTMGSVDGARHQTAAAAGGTLLSRVICQAGKGAFAGAIRRL